MPLSSTPSLKEHSTNLFETEGIRYTGSKREIIPRIIQIIQEQCPDVRTILDGCAGTTRVSQALRKNGFSVTANDLAAYIQVFGQCYLLNTKEHSYYEPMIKHLNNLKGIDGWFTENYGGSVTASKKGNAVQEDGKKRLWQRHNTQKLDAILAELSSITTDPIEKSVLLTSTILAMDKVDNTMGHQVAFLKQWPKRSYSPIKLYVPALIPTGEQCFISQKDICDIEEENDLAYIDIPYGTNNQKTKTTRVRYHSYYNVWTTICKNDRPSLHGAALRRKDASSDTLPKGVSVFESTKHHIVFDATKKLIENLNCRYVLFSYSNKGKLSEGDLRDIFSDYNLLKFSSFNHKENAMKTATTNEQWLGDQQKNQEYLILIDKIY